MKELKFTVHNGWLDKEGLRNSYYITPALKVQPYNVHYVRGFELVLWWIKGYVSVRILWKSKVSL